MLVDIEIENRFNFPKEWMPQNISVGVYLGRLEEFSSKLEVFFHMVDFNSTNLKEYMNWMQSEEYVPEYGICDCWEQIIEKYPAISNSNTHYVIALTSKITKETGDFRFHKNGEYIGKQNRQGFEYFSDETEMNEPVYTFMIYRIKECQTV